MDDKAITELINTGIVTDKIIKNATHYFCRAVMYENADNLQEGYISLCNKLRMYSDAHTRNTGIRPITWKDDLLAYFFNQKKHIPGHVYYFLNSFYEGVLGRAGSYSVRHYDIYNKLQRMYIEEHRFLKKDNKECERFLKQQRRQLSKLVRDGEYTETFKLCNGNISELITQNEIEKAALIFSTVFTERKLKNISSDECEQYAIAYLLGRIQGRSEAIT